MPQQQHPTQLPAEGYARLPVVRAVLGNAGRSTIHRWVKAGILPAPCRIGPRTVAWEVSALRAAMAKMGRTGK